MATLVNVGSFAKSIGAATAAQAVAHGLGSTPTAVIFWWCGQTSADTFGAACVGGFGFATANGSYSYSVGMTNAAATSVTSSRTAAKAISMVSGGEVLDSECDLSSFDATNINLSWTTNSATAYIINFIALGGDITNADVVNWQAPATATEQAVTGFGFAPDCIITCMGSSTSNVPASYAFADLNLGVATKQGGPWAIAIRDHDAQATMITNRAGLATAIGTVQGDNDGYGDALIQSWDADGFTAQFSVTTSGAEIITLGLKGGAYASGVVRKTGAAAVDTQLIASMPGAARGVILGSTFREGTHGYGAQARLGFGASDGTDEKAIVILSADNVADSDVDVYTASAKALVIADNNTPAVEAECDVTLSGGDVTLSWTTNDGGSHWIGYLVFGDESSTTSLGPRTFTQIGI